MFYHGINNFRALAIFLIVFGHCYWISNWQPQSMAARVYWYLIPGGTFFFAFISGFLFAHLNVPVFSYIEFIQKKFRNIALPYLIISLLPICYAVVSHYPGYFVDDRSGVYYQYLLPAVSYLFTGRVFTGYWYIPFIMLVFLLSPLLVRFYRAAHPLQISLTALLLCASIFIHRPVDNLNPLQSLAYFLPVFMAGMVFQKHFNWLKSRYLWLPWLLLLLSLLLSVYQSAFLGVVHNSHKAFFELQGPDLKVIEKMLQAVAVLMLFERYWHKRHAFIDLIASASFSIFFLHPLVIAVTKRVLQDRYSGFIYWHVLTIAVFSCTLLLTLLMKKLLGANSRPVIGW